MTSSTASLLAQSRSAHQQAKNALRVGNTAAARDAFRVALHARLQAREADPRREDAAWREDALHPAMPGESTRRHHRESGLTVDEVAAKKDAEYERYYREHLGEIIRTTVATDQDVIVPTRWVIVTLGQPDLCAQGHRFQLLFDRRVCARCQQIEERRDAMPVEQTLAHKERRSR